MKCEVAPKTERYLEKEANSLPAQNKTEPFLPSVPAGLFAPGHPTAPLLRPQAHRALLIARIMSSYGSFGISSPKNICNVLQHVSVFPYRTKRCCNISVINWASCISKWMEFACLFLQTVRASPLLF